eukprot:Nk52_evm30s270 gene=Nk52_evmTU30s270
MSFGGQSDLEVEALSFRAEEPLHGNASEDELELGLEEEKGNLGSGGMGELVLNGNKGRESNALQSTKPFTVLSHASKKSAYIPMQIATDKINRIADDMKAMKEKHINIVNEIGDNYRLIREETQGYFEDFINELKDRRHKEKNALSKVIANLQQQLKNNEETASSKLASAEDMYNALLSDNKNILEKCEDEIRKAKEEASSSIQAAEDQHKSEIEGLKTDKEKTDALSNELEIARDEIEKLKAELEEKNMLVTEQRALTKEVIKRSNESMVEAQERAEMRNVAGVSNGGDRAKLATVIAAQTTLEKQNSKLHHELKEKEIKLNRMLKRYEDLQHQFENYVSLAKDGPDAMTAKRAEIDSQKAEVEEEISQWREAFVEEEGRAPTSEDEAVVSEMFDRQREIENASTSLQIAETGAIPERMKPDEAQTKELEAFTTEALVGETRDLKEELDQEEVEKEKLSEAIKELKSELKTLNKTGKTKGDANSDGKLTISSVETTKLKRELELKEHELELMVINHSENMRVLESEKDSVKTDAMNQIETARNDLVVAKQACDAKVAKYKEEVKELQSKVNALEKLAKEQTPEELQSTFDELIQDLNKRQQESLDNLKAITKLELEKSKVEADLETIKASFRTIQEENNTLKASLHMSKATKEKKCDEIKDELDQKFDKYKEEDFVTIETLETRVQELEAGAPVIVMQEEEEEEEDDYSKRSPEELIKEIKKLHQVVIEKNKRIKELENNLAGKQAALQAARSGKPVDVDPKRQANMSKLGEDKKFKDVNNKLNAAMLTLTKTRKELEVANRQLKELQSEHKKLKTENEENKKELARLSGKGKADAEALAKIAALEQELIGLKKENARVAESYKAEHVLRKKYYNTIEDMKGKIRVYARARPLSKSEIEKKCKKAIMSPDEYSINVQAPRGIKEFQFDSVFTWDHTQDQVYEDTHNLIQSAVDGYNVCIFAYGQTGSGKTFTIVGAPSNPGIVPRAIEDIFKLIEENSAKFKFNVSCYMLELYNDQIIDLQSDNLVANPKMDIRKDAKGMVFVQGTIIKPANDAKTLYDLFNAGCEGRHVSSTKMNAESSRSHLIFSVLIESTNLATGQVLQGKLSLVDLAGSERVGKTGATAQRLKEAQSINKSLSALGDVISALSTGESFVPYRNNKLTQLMSDSLGGNAKTLMFVNVSPADYNCDETIISLTYASRVKLITNDAQKNADNQEIARLKSIIKKQKAGQEVDEEI